MAHIDGVAALADGDAVVVGGNSYSGLQGGAVAWSFSPDGERRWRHALPTLYAGLMAVAPAKNGFAVGGYGPSTKFGTVARMVRSDAFGNTSCAESGPCVAKTAGDCSDANSCTNDLCDAAHGGCWHEPFAEGVPCLPGKVCAGGKCVAP